LREVDGERWIERGGQRGCEVGVGEKRKKNKKMKVKKEFFPVFFTEM
jgi:hypothetical protein